MLDQYESSGAAADASVPTPASGAPRSPAPSSNRSAPTIAALSRHCRERPPATLCGKITTESGGLGTRSRRRSGLARRLDGQVSPDVGALPLGERVDDVVV